MRRHIAAETGSLLIVATIIATQYEGLTEIAMTQLVGRDIGLSVDTRLASITECEPHSATRKTKKKNATKRRAFGLLIDMTRRFCMQRKNNI